MNNVKRLYIHFPFCRHLCNYCDFYKRVKTKPSEVNEFHEYLEASMAGHNSFLKEMGYQYAPLSTIFIGGGTPSLWGKEGANFLKTLLSRQRIELEKDCEFTVEVNPGSWTKDDLISWREVGANRFSLGIQSLDSRFIKHLDRIHSLSDAFETLAFFKEENLEYSIDFMLGLPFSKDQGRDVIGELRQVLEFEPNHVSLYILTTKENYIHAQHLPSEEWIEDEYLKVSHFLETKGFDHYEVSNFARPGHESRHNLAYWNSQSVAAWGPSATGLLFEKGIRYKWRPLIPRFDREVLTSNELKLEKFYMLFRTNQGLRLSDYFESKDLEILSELAREWNEAGLIKIFDENSLCLTSKGYLQMDTLMDQIFSRTKSL